MRILALREHQTFKMELASKGNAQFEYLIHQPADPNREVYLTVLVFDVPGLPSHY
jgi:hypothetical protein